MHSTFVVNPVAPLARAPLWLRLATPLRAIAFALVALLGVCAPRLAQAQVYLGEVADNDIGRIGPTGMAIDTIATVSYLYVCDQNNGRVIKYNLSTGQRLAAWGHTGNGPFEFNSPYGIAIDPVSHDLFIAERGNHRIQRITNQGQFVMTWGTKGTANGEFDGPLGIAMDASGNVYVTDHNNNRVQKFRVSGTTVNHLATWGSPGTAPGQLNGPYGITLDAQGVLWVADAFNHRISKFDTNGNFLGVVGTFGPGDGQFNTPTWVTFDSTGAYYVCETNSNPQDGALADIQNQRIQKFSAAGTFITKWGSYGEAGGQFRLPFTIIVDATGTGYVSDYYNTRIQKYNLNAAPGASAPVINSTGAASGVVGQFFLYNTTAVSFPAATSFSATTLPQGLTINPISGAVMGNPTGGGNFTFTVTATNPVGSNSKTVSLAITGASGAPVITSAPQVNATVGIAYSYAITATNTPTSFGAQGIPPGLSLNATTGVISGVPTAAGPYTTVVTAANASGTGQMTVALTVNNASTDGMSSRTIAAGGTTTFTAQAGGTNTYQWYYNGAAIGGGTSQTYTVPSVQPASAGIYSVVINGSTTQTAILGVSTNLKVAGAGKEIASDIVHQNGNIYDQVLLQGTAATITADPGQITRMSYIDLNDDIVQIEFSGAGSLTVTLESASGPAAPTKYNQPTVAYMKGHASIILAGGNQTTNVSVFSVGRANAVNQSLFRTDVTYDGFADISTLSVVSANGQFAGVRTANASYFNSHGLTGVYAPGVQITGPLYIGDVSASGGATPVIMIGAGNTTQINGGDLLQANAADVQVSGLSQLQFVAGSTSHGVILPAQNCRARLMQNGVDVTSQVVVNPN